MFILLLLAQFAHAGECPWKEGEPLAVHADMRSVTINGDYYAVRGAMNRYDFEEILDDCDMTRAKYNFRAWRGMRRCTNISAVLGLLVVWPALALTPACAVSAAPLKNDMARNIEGWN